MGGVEKISSEHLARIAFTYVRQSTPAQVRNNTESRELQYELKERAVQLGWPAERVRVIDSDLGISANSAALADREGFRELAGEVALGDHRHPRLGRSAGHGALPPKGPARRPRQEQDLRPRRKNSRGSPRHRHPITTARRTRKLPLLSPEPRHGGACVPDP
jgi:hypothetical protein